MKTLNSLSKKMQFAAYALYVLELLDSNAIDYWIAYENCFNEEIINEIKEQFYDQDLIDAILLLSEYDFCRDCLTEEKIQKSKTEIVLLLKKVIEKEMLLDVK